MGHIINSNSLRLGWFSNWSDNWFVDSIYYSEFLFIVLRIRFFLTYMFADRHFEDVGYFYSHFEIYNKSNCINISIFFYDGFVENILDDLFSSHYIEVRKYNSALKDRKPLWIYEPWKMFIVLNWIHKFSFNNWPLKSIENLIKALNIISLNFMIRTIFSKRIPVESRAGASRFIFFYTIYFNLKLIVSNNYIKKTDKDNHIFSRFIYAIAWSSWNKDLFLSIRLFIIFVLKRILKWDNFSVNFYALTSFTVNAKFLSKYIGKKLKQNYSVKELINPIKRELNALNKSSKFPLSNYLYSLKKHSYDIKYVSSFKRGLFKTLLLFFLICIINIIINIIIFIKLGFLLIWWLFTHGL